MPTDVIIDPTSGQIYWNNGGGGNQESISIKGDALNAISFVGYSGQYSPGSSVGGTQTLVTVNDSAGANALIPGSNGFDLGNDTTRWKLYATTGNFSNNSSTTSLATGAVIINGGIAISGGASIGQSLFLYGVGTASTSYTGLKAGSVTSNTLYTLPITYPATGTSVLQSDTAGTMTWVPVSSGTPGGSNKQIQYNNSNAFGGASGFEYTTGGSGVTVAIFSTAGAGYTAGMWVNSINGITTKVGIGVSNPQFELEVNGEISATNKSFVINHPTKPGMKLRYGSLEGPENGVYIRGISTSNIIDLPDYWLGLIDYNTITVHLTPIGKNNSHYFIKCEDNKVYIGTSLFKKINCFYSIWAERKDVSKLIVEY